MRRRATYHVDWELANRLFALATAKLEDAIEHAIAGQSATLDATRLNAEAMRLRKMVEGVGILAEAVTITVGSPVTPARGLAVKRPRRKRSTSP